METPWIVEVTNCAFIWRRAFEKDSSHVVIATLLTDPPVGQQAPFLHPLEHDLVLEKAKGMETPLIVEVTNCAFIWRRAF